MGASLVFGLDEAGRGPVLGPMALAVVGLSAAAARALVGAGLDDSKAFGSSPAGRRKRAELAAEVEARAAFVRCVLVPAFVVDAYTERRALDDLEREVACDLVVAARREHDGPVVCDGARIFGRLARRFPGLVARNRADATEPAVAAASVVAKQARDAALARLLAPYEARFGPIGGGGYANAATRRFLRAHLEAEGTLPGFARRTFLRGGFLDGPAQQPLPYGPER